MLDAARETAFRRPKRMTDSLRELQWRSDLASAHGSAPSKDRLQTCIELALSISGISLGWCGSEMSERA